LLGLFLFLSLWVILGFLAWVVFLFDFVGYIRVACLGCFVFVFVVMLGLLAWGAVASLI
jgi:hypothetical protein